MTEYVVIYETDQRGGWSAWSPDVEGCYAAAETFDEIQTGMAEAIRFHLDCLRDEGLDIPEPRHRTGLVAT